MLKEREKKSIKLSYDMVNWRRESEREFFVGNILQRDATRLLLQLEG